MCACVDKSTGINGLGYCQINLKTRFSCFSFFFFFSSNAFLKFGIKISEEFFWFKIVPLVTEKHVPNSNFDVFYGYAEGVSS